MHSDRERFDRIKKHFNTESEKFDPIIKARVPFYDIFIEALVNVLPFGKDDTIKTVDLGCGTGAVALHVKERFPNAVITCVDFSKEMLLTAQKKMSGYTDISFHESDVLDFDLKGYDAVLSSLCLHHIGIEDGKEDFFKKVYEGLSTGGVFYIYDVVLAPSKELQDAYLEEWKKYMGKNLSREEVESTVIKYHEEDRPCVLMEELKWLEKAGFKNVDVICKFYNGAVYGGVKN